MYLATPLRNRRRKQQTRNKGIAAVELAIIAPVLIGILFLMAETSRFLMAKHATTGAAREAARAVAVTAADDQTATGIAQTYMENSFFGSDSLEVVISPTQSTIPGMNMISCTVTLDFADVSLIGDPFNLGVLHIDGYSAMLAPSSDD